jgi:hypothetical protein
MERQHQERGAVAEVRLAQYCLVPRFQEWDVLPIPRLRLRHEIEPSKNSLSRGRAFEPPRNTENLCLQRRLPGLQRGHPQPRLRNPDRQFWILQVSGFTIRSEVRADLRTTES